MMDPSLFGDFQSFHNFHDLPQHLDSIQSAFSSILLSDDLDLTSMVSDAPAAVSDAVVAAPAAAVSEAAATATTTNNGWFGFLTGPIEGLLQLIHSGIVALGASENAWGVSIIMLTLLIKLVTYPLSKAQLESSTKMQMIQPEIKSVQAKYASNPEVMNQKVAELYQTNDVNPLAGCLPAIVTLPVFISLYRAVSTLATENRLNEPFLWLPNLEGPTYGADPASANQWLTSGWVNGVPPLGWEDTIAFLTIPVLLIITQTLSQQLMQPKNMTPEQEAQQNNIVLKLLPLLVAFFSINVPAALGVYFVVNNIITTAISVQIRTALESNPPTFGSGGAATANVINAPVSTFTPAPMREKPSGFASSTSELEEVTPITPIDAEILEAEDPDSAGEVPRAAPSKSSTKKKRKTRKKK